MRSDDGRAERLFRAAVAAFCALPRPTRRDAVQLDDLTLPRYRQVSPESRRYVAAVLSECGRAPPLLVRKLADEPIEISAPLLIRSSSLTDIDLIALIAHHGLPHARAIRARPTLNPAIERLIDALLAAAPAPVPAIGSDEGAEADEADEHVPLLEEEIVMSPSPEPVRPQAGSAAEVMRSRLRAMMAVGGEATSAAPTPAPLAGRDLYDKLRDTAFTGVPALFQTALADAAGIGFTEANPLIQPARRRSLLLVLRGLDLTVEQAFLIVSALDPGAHAHAETVRLFHETYGLMHPEAGRDEIRRLRADSLAAMIKRPLSRPAEEAAALPQGLLKAS